MQWSGGYLLVMSFSKHFLTDTKCKENRWTDF